MYRTPLWLRIEQTLGMALRRSSQWPPGYLRFVLSKNKSCLAIPTHMTRSELMLLYRTGLDSRKGGFFVEVGSYLGASSCCLAAAARERKAHLLCVDTWQNEGMSEGLRDTYGEFLQNVAPYRAWLTPLRGNSIDIASQTDKTVDLLFLDGDHSYPGVVSDLTGWLPKLKFGSWLLMHDWGWAEGVERAISEIVVRIQVEKPVVLPNLYGVRVDPRLAGFGT